jgi:hypothetical protein
VKLLKKYNMKNWKTSLLGIIIAVCTALQPLVLNEGLKWYNFVLAAAIAAFGFIAKDFDKTGI